MRGLLEAPIVEHHTYITSSNKMGHLLQAIERYSGRRLTQLALQLSSLLFVRPGELLHAGLTLHRRGYRLLVPLEPVVSPPEAAPSAAPGRIVGRLSELAALENRLTQAIPGRLLLVFVIGEPGIGKAALLDIFADRHTASSELAASPALILGTCLCSSFWMPLPQGAGQHYLRVVRWAPGRGWFTRG
jgi:hypothetical protein